jgi:hypothetical protein
LLLNDKTPILEIAKSEDQKQTLSDIFEVEETKITGIDEQDSFDK